MSKILIVEDDEAIRDAYQETFTDAQFTVETAVDGAQAMQKIQLFLPDIILLDLMTPNVDGFEVLDTLKANEQTKQIKVIIFTNVFVNRDELLEHGALAVWLKTDYTPGQLVTRVRKVLGLPDQPASKTN